MTHTPCAENTTEVAIINDTGHSKIPREQSAPPTEEMEAAGGKEGWVSIATTQLKQSSHLSTIVEPSL